MQTVHCTGRTCSATIKHDAILIWSRFTHVSIPPLSAIHLRPSGSRMSVNTKMEHRTLAWVLVINERAWFFSVLFDSVQRGKIDVMRKGLFHCGRLQSRGVKQENSADEPCFNVFYVFRLNNTVFSRRRMGSESQDEFEEKPWNEKMSSSTVRSRLIPRGAVESLTISDWSVGGSNLVEDVFSIFFFSFFFRFLSWCSFGEFFSYSSHSSRKTEAGNNFRSNFLLNK